MTQLVTMVYMVLDPARNELVAANAGHPPPVILRADGRPEQLPLANGAPLGIASGERESVTIEFHAGDTVMAFTDGLIERREEDIDKGQQRLLDNVPTFGRSSLADALPLIIEAVRDHTREDDVAALAVRQEPRLSPARCRRAPAGPSSSPVVRHTCSRIRLEELRDPLPL